MISPAQVQANRKNASRSTGPRTAKGKKAVARNALRHGLAVPIAALAEYDPPITRLAAILAGTETSPNRLDAARQVAEAEFDIVRVRRARVALLDAPLFERPPKKRRLGIKFLRQFAEALCSQDPVLTEQFVSVIAPEPKPIKLDENERFAAIVAARLVELRRIDRYERRALSRRKKAIRALDDLGPIAS